MRSGWAATLLAVACAGPAGGDTALPACGEPALGLAAQRGDRVTVVHGPQGGWHVEVEGEVVGLGPVVSVAPTVVDVTSGQRLAGDQPPVLVDLVGHDGCAGEFRDVRAYVDDVDWAGPFIDFVCGLAGRPLHLRVEVSDAAGERSAEAEVDVVAARDPADEPLCP